MATQPDPDRQPNEVPYLKKSEALSIGHDLLRLAAEAGEAIYDSRLAKQLAARLESYYEPIRWLEEWIERVREEGRPRD